MWPRLIPQMIELLPHVRRLVPMADRFFTSKAETERAHEATLNALASELRADLAQVAKTHAGLYRQLQDQTAVIAEVGEEVKRSRLAMEHHGTRIESIETTVAQLGRWLKIGLSLVLVLLAILILLVAQWMHTH